MAKYQVNKKAWGRARRPSGPKPLSDFQVEVLAPQIAVYLMNEQSGSGAPVYRDPQTGQWVIPNATGTSAVVRQLSELFVAVQDILEAVGQEDEVQRMTHQGGQVFNGPYGGSVTQFGQGNHPAGSAGTVAGPGVQAGTGLLNQLAPLVGGAAGMYFGGPAGAMAGYQGGQMAADIAQPALNYVEKALPSMPESFEAGLKSMGFGG